MTGSVGFHHSSIDSSSGCDLLRRTSRVQKVQASCRTEAAICRIGQTRTVAILPPGDGTIQKLAARKTAPLGHGGVQMVPANIGYTEMAAVARKWRERE